MNHYDRPIIFFDGVCGLCNRSVDFIMRQDKKEQFFFAPLQGNTAKSLLGKALTENLSSFVYYRNGKILTKSAAALAVMKNLGGIFCLAVVFYIIPRFIRDIVYDYIAEQRYSWFGKKEACRIPSPNEKKFFLP